MLPSWDEELVENLLVELKETKNPQIREKLILMHRELVQRLARRFANRGEPLEDIVQVATIGLINAIDRFEPKRGAKFITYALPNILGEIKRYFRDKGWAFKVPRKVKDLVLEIDKVIESMSHELNRSPTVEEIAARVRASEEQVLEALGTKELLSLDSEVYRSDEDVRKVLSDYVKVEDDSIEHLVLADDVRKAMDKLDEQEKKVIYLRFFEDLSQTQIAKEGGISQPEVSRIQRRALQKLKRFICGSDVLPSGPNSRTRKRK